MIHRRISRVGELRKSSRLTLAVADQTKQISTANSILFRDARLFIGSSLPSFSCLLHCHPARASSLFPRLPILSHSASVKRSHVKKRKNERSLVVCLYIGHRACAQAGHTPPKHAGTGTESESLIHCVGLRSQPFPRLKAKKKKLVLKYRHFTLFCSKRLVVWLVLPSTPPSFPWTRSRRGSSPRQGSQPQEDSEESIQD